VLCKVCYGTNVGLHFSGWKTADERYKLYNETYTNCTIVNGNLEIVHLMDGNKTFSLDFLSEIREVTPRQSVE